MKVSLSLLTVLFISAIPISRAPAALIADSINDFTSDGTQGALGWTGGYRNYTLDGGGEDYDADTEFLAFDQATHWRGAGWRLVAANAPWTTLDAESAHPNGTNNVDEHWVIRRWAAAATQPIAVTWQVRKQNTNGAGVSGSLHHEGVQMDAAAVAGNDGTGVNRTYYINAVSGDRIDLALTPVGPDGDRLDGSDGSFFSMVIDDEVNDVEFQPDGGIFIASDAVDSDNDNLADAWEEIYFPGDLTVLDGDGVADNDNDGLTDLDEQSRNTNPDNEDSDSDGLNDFVEIDEHNTDPLAADTDGDGLDDGDEVLTYMTEPLIVDTDLDTFSDGEEVAAGSDPNDINDTPLTQVVANSSDDWNLSPGEQGFENWTYGYRDFSADGGAESYNPSSDFILFTGGVAGGVWDGVAQQWSGTAWDLNTAAAAPWTFIGQETTHPNSDTNGGEHWTIRRWTADVTTVTPVAIHWHLRKNNANGDGVSGSVHVNGMQIDKSTIPGTDMVGFERTVYANLLPGDRVDLTQTPEGVTNRADGSDASSNWMRVDLRIPADPMQPDGTPFIPATGDDIDADDLPDVWEEQFFPGDLTKLSGLGGADFEADGSPDLEEFQRGTHPDDPDSDDDGLEDGVETDDGNFVDENATGTSPTDADTDGDGIEDNDEVTAANGFATNPTLADTDSDGLNDGDEITLMTDPLDDDTDDDTYLDGDEVARGFDPLDPASNPGTLLADSFDDFSGVQGQANWTNGYRNFTQDGGATDYDAANDFIPFVGEEGLGPWDGTAQQWDGAKWDLLQGGGPWTEIGSEATHPNGINSAPNDEHWTIRRWVAVDLAATTPLSLTWHIREVNLGGTGVSGSLHINGVQVDMLALAGGDGVGAVRTWYANVNPGDVIDLALSPVGLDGDTSDGSDGSANWLRIDTYIPPNPTQPDGTPFAPASGQDFRVTKIELNEATGELTVTWPSAVGRLYGVEINFDLTADNWLEQDDGIEGQETETSYTVTLDPLPARVFVRVVDLTGQ